MNSPPPLDVTRWTLLDSQWGEGRLTLKVELDNWSRLDYDIITSKVVDTVQSNAPNVHKSWLPHRAVDKSPDGKLVRIGFLYEYNAPKALKKMLKELVSPSKAGEVKIQNHVCEAI